MMAATVAATSALLSDAGTPAMAGKGSASGLAAANDQSWDQDTIDVEGDAEVGDAFGLALASGDFNGDGALDLAIGVPFEDVGSMADTGVVNVIYGSAGHLTAAGDQIWHQDQPGVEGSADAGDFFGLAVAAGDFNGDGRDDLAIGVPGESVEALDVAGAVNVLYGSATGLSATGNQVWHQDVADLEGTAEAGDLFGWALAAGDFNNDGRDDLAVGIPGEHVSGAVAAGAANVLYGSPTGLGAAGDQIWHQDTADVEGIAEEFDHFGLSLATGDFNDDGDDDLAIGVPTEDDESISDAGAVNVLYGSGSGLTAAGDQIWHQDQPDVEGAAEASDSFGDALATGDFDGDGRDDLAIGIPEEDVESFADAGAVNVLYGSAGGLTAAGDQIWDRDIVELEGGVQALDRFGYALAAGDFNSDGHDDLAIGVPFEEIDNIANAGAVDVLYGSAGGLMAAGHQLWHQDVADVEGAAESGDEFGLTLAAGDFDGDGRGDLAIAVTEEDVGAIADAGSVNVLYGSPLTPDLTPTRTLTPTPTATAPVAATPTHTPPGGATATPTRTSTVRASRVGDADCSDTVTAIDALFVLQFIAGLLEALPCPAAADVNGDGAVTAVDATLILQYVAGLVDSLPP